MKPMTADYVAAVRDHLIDLLYVAGEMVALIEMVPRTDHLLIENVAVLPAWQRRGHGSALIAHAERLAASLGYCEMRLYTNGLLTGNIRLYRSLGYQPDHEEAFKGAFIVHMSKRL